MLGYGNVLVTNAHTSNMTDVESATTIQEITERCLNKEKDEFCNHSSMKNGTGLEDSKVSIKSCSNLSGEEVSNAINSPDSESSFGKCARTSKSDGVAKLSPNKVFLQY